MIASIVTSGLLCQGLVTGGLQQTGIPATPAQSAVEARAGTVLFPDSGALAVDPRQGTVIN